MLRFRGSEHLRQRLVCATLSGKAIRIDDIRAQDQNPGLRDYEASLLRLLEKVTNGCIIEINETGAPAGGGGRRAGAGGRSSAYLPIGLGQPDGLDGQNAEKRRSRVLQPASCRLAAEARSLLHAPAHPPSRRPPPPLLHWQAPACGTSRASSMGARGWSTTAAPAGPLAISWSRWPSWPFLGRRCVGWKRRRLGK